MREREKRQGDMPEVMGKPSSETVIWVICQLLSAGELDVFPIKLGCKGSVFL